MREAQIVMANAICSALTDARKSSLPGMTLMYVPFRPTWTGPQTLWVYCASFSLKGLAAVHLFPCVCSFFFPDATFGESHSDTCTRTQLGAKGSCSDRLLPK